jgi:hypothetical protein
MPKFQGLTRAEGVLEGTHLTLKDQTNKETIRLSLRMTNLIRSKYLRQSLAQLIC